MGSNTGTCADGFGTSAGAANEAGGWYNNQMIASGGTNTSGTGAGSAGNSTDAGISAVSGDGGRNISRAIEEAQEPASEDEDMLD